MEFLDVLLGSNASRSATLAAMSPVVLLGRGHSGTRVLAWMCVHLGVKLGTSSPHVEGDPDDVTFTNKIKALAAHNLDVTSPADVREHALRRFKAAVSKYYAGLGNPSGMWGWKFPETYLIAPYVARTFPRARYLHLVRDGRDIAFKSHLTDNPRHRVGKAVLSACHALELPDHLRAAASWAYQVDRFDAFRDHLPASSVLDMRFEDLCTSPAESAERLSAFLGAPMTDACREYVASGIDTLKVAQYREQDPRLVDEVKDRIGATLRRYRYLP
jgi:sulfotransferase family protein